MPDGKLAVFDWALTTELSNTQMAAVVQALLCAAALDEPGVIGALGVLGAVKREADLRTAVAGALADVRHGTFPGSPGSHRCWMSSHAQECGVSGGNGVVPETLLTLTGVIRDVWPDASIDKVLVASGSRQLIGERGCGLLHPWSRGSSGRIFRARICCES